MFLGLPAAAESEGYDREHIDLPADQLELLDAVLEVNPNTVVVLSNGSVVALPFADRVPAILEAWLLGQAGGGATADVLYGEVNPSAKLTETIPLRLRGHPVVPELRRGRSRPLRRGTVRRLPLVRRPRHRRRVPIRPWALVHDVRVCGCRGIRRCERRRRGARDRDEHRRPGRPRGRAGLHVARRTRLCSVRCASSRRSPRWSSRPARAAKWSLTVRRDDLAYWDVPAQRWVVEGGTYLVDVAASSRDLRSSATVVVEGDAVVRPLSRESSMGEVFAHPIAGPDRSAGDGAGDDRHGRGCRLDHARGRGHDRR